MSELYRIEQESLTTIADAIRTKTGETQDLTLEQMASEINGINIEPMLQNKTVTPTTSSQSIKADSGYDGLDTVTVNAMPTATQATPSITVSTGGLITASATQSAGYVSAGTKSNTKQLTTQAAKTITPTKSAQTAVASGRYTTGAVTVAAIPSSYVQPSGTLTITANGTHDVTNYASATVNVAGSGGGGSLKTCSISGLDFYAVYYTGVENGEIVCKTLANGHDSVAIEVLCNSVIYYDRYDSEVGTIELTGGFELLTCGTGNKYVAIKASPTEGAAGSFSTVFDLI